MIDMIFLVIKTFLIYFMILFVMKFMGKREIGQLSLFDFIVLLLIADVAVIAIDLNKDYIEFLYSLIPILTLAVIQKTLAFLLLKIPMFRDFFDGKESIIIDNGVLDVKELRKQRYNIDDLIPVIRLKNIKSFSEVKYLIIEPNGEISIFTYEKENLVSYTYLNHASPLMATKHSVNKENKTYSESIFPIITSGVLHKENIKRININEQWVKKEIKKQGYNEIKDIYYATFENNKLFILKTKQ